jgi:hypothetical protein
MARSYKKYAISGNCVSTSEKSYKRERVRLERARCREALHLMKISQGSEGESPSYELAPWDEWQTDRDGKVYIGHRDVVDASLLRK